MPGKPYHKEQSLNPPTGPTGETFHEEQSLDYTVRVLERTTHTLDEQYRAALACDLDPSDELGKVDVSIGRIQEQLGKLRQMRARSTAAAAKKRKQTTYNIELENPWLEVMYGGPKHRFQSFRDIVKRVQLETRCLFHWKNQTSCSVDQPGPGTLRTSTLLQILQSNHQLYNLHSWKLDVFEIDAETHQSLVHIFMAGWWDRGMDKLCKAKENKVVEFATALQSAYKKNPYHNRMHAADVMASAYYLVNRILEQPNMNSFFNDLDVMCIFVAAAIHDVAHPGVSNDFLVKTRDALAIRYNDISVLENYHAATAFGMMQDLGTDLLDHTLPGPAASSLRRRVVDMVLATDMSHHKETLDNLASEIARQQQLQDVDKLTLERHLLHMADVGHPLRHFAVHEKWSLRVAEEFFLQGDQERRLGQEPLVLFDRHRAPPMATGQLGFLNFVVQPMWDVLAPVLGPGGREPGKCLGDNKAAWTRLAEAQAAQKAREKT